MKIILLNIKDYKRVKSVRILPGGTNLILIGGMNGEGKTSCLGSMSAGLGGKGEEPDQPIRDGAEFSEIIIELGDDAGELGYEVRRRFLKNGKTSLKVTGKDGRLSSPQKILDKIVGNRFLDPLKFSLLKDKQQLETLLTVVDIGIDLKEFTRSRKKFFDARTDSNRSVKRYKVELEANPHPGEIGDVASGDIVDTINKLMRQKHARTEVGDELDRLRREMEDYGRSTSRIRADLLIEEDLLKAVIAKGKKLKGEWDDMPDVTEDLSAAQAELSAYSSMEAKRNEALSQLGRHTSAKAALDEAEEESLSLSERISELDKDKADKLAAAKMPIDNLEIGDEKLIYKGHPLSQASGAEKLSVSLALAAAMSPELRDIWVEDGSLLDENSLKLMNTFAEKNNLRIWLERVGVSDEGAIIIEDGMIKGDDGGI